MLLVVGQGSPNSTIQHRRLREYTYADYLLLLRLLGDGARVATTTHCLAEASNLLRQDRDPRVGIRCLRRLRILLGGGLLEVHHFLVDIADAVPQVYEVLGLADAGLYYCLPDFDALITVDRDLYALAVRRSPNSAINLNHFRG